MRRRGFARLRGLARGLMVVAAFAFAVQGIAAMSFAAGDSADGIAVWHAHVLDDGTKQVHAHAPGKDGDGGHHDHDGKLKACGVHAAASMPPPVALPELIAPGGRAFAELAAQLPRGLDPGGLRRPPRTPDIA